MLDYLIKNGLIVDGSGAEPFESNIGIINDKIAYIGREEPCSNVVINANDLIVSPGFIDVHSHSEFTILADSRCQAKISQGITTEINGNCGLSAAPLYKEAMEYREVDLKEFGIKERWTEFREYFGILKDKGIALNFATLCGHGNIRASVIGYENKMPDESQIAEMKRLLLNSLNDGAKGLSTGLIYPPGIYSDTEELIELCRSLNSSHIYTSHMRCEGDRLIESIAEVIRIGREGNVKVHISHIKISGDNNWHKIKEVINLLDDAKRSGVNLTCDAYPYTAASTDLDTILPSWVYEGGISMEIKRLIDPMTRNRVIEFLNHKHEDYWQGVYISNVTKSKNKWMEGKSISEIATKLNKRATDLVVDLLVDERARIGAIFFLMREDNLKSFLSLPYVMIGSDSSSRSFSGPTYLGKPHPRGFGSFPRFIGKYVRDEGLISLPEAIRRITSLPSETFRLQGRGLIKEGFFADITVFDYNNIIDKATYNDPFIKPEGIRYVFVNGQVAYRDGEFTGSLSGAVI